MPRPSGPTPGNQCTANLKTCPIARGGCGYRYQKTDTKWQDGGKCPQCGLDRRCIAAPVDGYKVCTKHGAGSPHKGRIPGIPANGDLRKVYLPKQMARDYERAMTDPTLRKFDRDLALEESIINDLQRQLATGESLKAWEVLSKQLPDFISALRFHCRAFETAQRQIANQGINPENRKALADAINNLTGTINGTTPDDLMDITKKGRYTASLRTELKEHQEQRRKILDSDLNQAKTLKAMVALDSFVRFTEAVAVIIEKRIEDPHLRNAIGLDVQQLLSLPEGPTVDISREQYRELEAERGR